MEYKHNHLIAYGLEMFLEIFSNPLLIDKAIMAREALKLTRLDHVLSIGNTKKTVAISLSGAKVLGVVSKEGNFNDGVAMINQHGFMFDRMRIDSNDLLSDLNLSEVQKLIIDSVLFGVALYLQTSKTYGPLSVNLMTIAEHDIDASRLLSHDLNSHFREILLAHVSEHLRFNGEALDNESRKKIEQIKEGFYAQAAGERGIEINDALLTLPARREQKRSLSDEKILKHQYDWLSIFALDLPSGKASRAEYHAKVELLTLRQQLLDISVKGGWDVGWQLNRHWLTTGEGTNDYQWLPGRVDKVLKIIKNAFFNECRAPECFQKALIEAE